MIGGLGGHTMIGGLEGNTMIGGVRKQHNDREG
jgi:hypothetical protein